jgi:hypothetical protein
MAGQAGGDDRAPAAPPAPADSGAGLEATAGGIEDEPWAPNRRVRTCVASLAESRSFGPMVAGEAQARDFYAAGRRAFVADGLAYNWSIQETLLADPHPSSRLFLAPALRR